MYSFLSRNCCCKWAFCCVQTWHQTFVDLSIIALNGYECLCFDALDNITPPGIHWAISGVQKVHWAMRRWRKRKMETTQSWGRNWRISKNWTCGFVEAWLWWFFSGDLHIWICKICCEDVLAPFVWMERLLGKLFSVQSRLYMQKWYLCGISWSSVKFFIIHHASCMRFSDSQVACVASKKASNCKPSQQHILSNFLVFKEATWMLLSCWMTQSSWVTGCYKSKVPKFLSP